MMLSDSLLGWGSVLLATIAELAGIFGLSLYSKKRNVLNFILYYGGIALSFLFLYLSFKYLPTSISYAVFSGLGTAGAILINILFFKESKNIKRIISIGFIIFGICGLKLVS